MTFKEYLAEIETIIENAYSGTTLDEAEKLAAKFLSAQLKVSTRLKAADLDARMHKSGLKAIKAAVYTTAVSEAEKKPTEAALENILNLNKDVQAEQDAFDTAEADRNELDRIYNVCREAHVYFRGVAKGRFE